MLLKKMNHKVTCGTCGSLVVVPCRRHNKAGTGWHGAKDIKRLGKLDNLVLEVLEMRMADSVWRGLTSRQVHREVCELIRVRAKPGVNPVSPDLGSVRRALSYMQGDGKFQFVKSAENIVELKDEDEMSFRIKNPNVWFLRRPEGRGLLKPLFSLQ